MSMENYCSQLQSQLVTDTVTGAQQAQKLQAQAAFYPLTTSTSKKSRMYEESGVKSTISKPVVVLANAV
jgi:hypothetical protein